MPFRQYRVWEIEDLPDGYLAWLTAIDLHGWLHDAIHNEYHRRTDQYVSREHHTPPPPAAPGIRLRPEEVPLARRLVEAAYRSLARVMHPHKGGDTSEMQRLNALAGTVRDQLDALEVKGAQP
jgi:hypothetical protein